MSLAVQTFVIYSQPDCPHCDRAKHLIWERGFAFLEIDLTKVSEADREMFKASFPEKERTVPKVYLNGTLIGGADELAQFMKSPMATQVLGASHVPPIIIKRMSATAIKPTRGTEESIGLDLYADLGIGESVTVPPNEIRKIGTGWAMKAPPHHYLRCAPRGGMAMKGIDIMAGVVDRDYRGEVLVILANNNFENVTIKHGDKFAQIIAERATIAEAVEVSELEATKRGEGKFGSTGW